MKKGVVITTDNKVYPVELSEPLFQGAKEILGGYMEHVWPGGLKRPYCLLCNEEGLLMGLPMNAYGSFLYRTQIHGSPIVGNIIIMKDGYENGEPDIVGLTHEEAAEISKQATDWIKSFGGGDES